VPPFFGGRAGSIADQGEQSNTVVFCHGFPQPGTMAAKRRRSSSPKAIVVRDRVSSPAPIRISVPRAPAIKKHRRRRSHSIARSHGIGGGATGAMSMNRSGALALGGFLYGIIEKNFGPQLPSLPILGKTGSIALGCYFLGGKSPGLIADVGNAASVIAGYSFGSTGKVSGSLAPQVSGIAAQV
jgi:hypothetical protein